MLIVTLKEIRVVDLFSLNLISPNRFFPANG